MALQDWLHWIGLARKAGKLAPGDRQVREAMRDESAKVVIIAEDAGQAVYRKYHLWAQDLGIPVIQQASKRDLGHAMGMGRTRSLRCKMKRLRKRFWPRLQTMQEG